MWFKNKLEIRVLPLGKLDEYMDLKYCVLQLIQAVVWHWLLRPNTTHLKSYNLFLKNDPYQISTDKFKVKLIADSAEFPSHFYLWLAGDGGDIG